MTGQTRPWRSPSVLGAALAALLAVVFDLALGGAGGESSEFALFLGRFHPLLVHLPIGVFLLVAAAEAASFASRLRERIDPVLGLVLPVLVGSALAAFLLGHLLAREGGFPAQSLLWHRRLVLVALLGACACLAAWSYREHRNGRLAYRVLLVLSLGVLSLGAHFGGTMTRGEAYLAKYAPGPLKPLLGGARTTKAEATPVEPAAKSEEPLIYADLVRPLFAEYCVECHGPEKAKGGLRLDSLEHVAKGGESGPALVPGSAERSAIMRRMLLPAGDDERMPPDDKPAPSLEQIALVRFWIDRGANEALRVRDALPPENTRALLERALSRAGTVAHAPTAPAAPAASSSAEPETAASGAPASAQAHPASVAAPANAAPSPFAILADKCEKCHGPQKAKGKLRVDSMQALLAGGDAGPAIVPGDPDGSELLRRVRLAPDAEGHMPPRKEPQLTAQEIAVLSAWIRGLGRKATAAPKPEPALVHSAPSTAEVAAETRPAVAADLEGAKEGAQVQPASVVSLPPRMFSEVIQPLLQRRCAKCHSGKQPVAKLSVDTHAQLIAGGSSGPAVIPGRPEQSLLLSRMLVALSDPDRMPPEDEPQPTDDEIAAVRLWIEGGAPDDSAQVETGAGVEHAATGGPRPAAAGHATVNARPAGCGACALGGSRAPVTGVFSALLAVVLFALRRRTRSVAA